MSHPSYWPGQIFFYPVGNTPATCLTENLPPECNADMLLLGCGDARHILYTVYADATRSMAALRKLDVTCCDMKAAVLARNTLLFTLLADDGAEKKLANIWNIFYHMMLNEGSLSLLIEQCRKLVPLAKDMETWREGPYSHIVTMCNVDTLSDIQRFWKLWLGTADFNAQQMKYFAENFEDGLKKARTRFEGQFVMTSMRSAGPLAPVTLKAVTDQFKRFWATGVTDDGIRDARLAKNVNPTFAFSASRDKGAVHYGTDPIAGFHLAETLASAGCTLSDERATVKIVQAARDQFSSWCKAVIGRIQHTSASSASLIVRMYAGEALAFCRALHSVGTTSSHTPPFVAPWKRSVVQFDTTAYGLHAPFPAPTSFDVIETSNLLDHLGFHNLLTVTVPLLCDSPSSTLYTETLLAPGELVTEGILTHMCGDPSTISLLLGVVPSAYYSRFTTHSNMSETLLLALGDGSFIQYYERLAWKPVGQGHATRHPQDEPIQLAPDQLARTLFGIYLKMFSDENISERLSMMGRSRAEVLRRVQYSGLIHYTRRSFALLLAHIRKRVQCDWNEVIDIFERLVLEDDTLITGSNFYQEMAGQLHLAGFTLRWMSPMTVRELRAREDPPILRDWRTVPQVVTVVLVVPRHAITKVQSELSDAGTPILQCETRVASSHSAFACISASFGKLEVSGRGENKTVVITEDSTGVHGTSSMVVSFPALTTTLIHTSGGTVGLAVRSTLSTMPLVQKLGLEMCLFKTLLTDERYVHILTKAPTINNDATDGATSSVPSGRSDSTAEHQPIHVEMDASNTRVQSFTARITLTDAAEQVAFAGGCTVRITQLSANQITLHVDKHLHIVDFPLPVSAVNAKVRVARKSKYVEIVAPMTLTLAVKGERRIAENFRMTIDNGIPTLWNVHRLNLDRCPSFKLSTDPKAFNWFIPHMSHMFSHRERAARKRHYATPRSVQDTFMNVKDSLYTFFLSATGLGTGQAHVEFGLINPATDDIYAIILVTDLRLDLASHTVVADSWIIPGSDDIQDRLRDELKTMLSIKTDTNESEAWRYLLPLFIERCRLWEHKANCEYPAQNSAPLYPEAGSDPDKVPFCSCGMGVGTAVLRKRYGDTAATYATRAAISPLFPVSYLERVGMMDYSETVTEPVSTGCRTCGDEGKALSACGRCKKVKYCSKECQVQDWKRHKKDCT
ncbi:hypothetical protein V8B97DRAFT_1962113 [Scleroderma yunnanense]